MKRLLGSLLLISMLGTALSACGGLPEHASETVCSFMDIKWVLENDSCGEEIYFDSDGDCGYYCGCGEPLNCDDLCEGYSYDEESRTIHLEFSGLAIGATDEICVLHCDGNYLVLDFDGEEHIFKNEKLREEADDYESHFTYKKEEYYELRFPQDIFYYDLTNSVSVEEDDALLIPHERWTLLYRYDRLNVLDAQRKEAKEYFANDDNYTWRITVEEPDSDKVTVIPLTLTEKDLSYVYEMEDMKGDKTLRFDEIECFGTLEKVEKTGVITGRTSLALAGGEWYWRSETIDDSAEGWPEYVVPLPDSIQGQLQSAGN